MMETASQTTSRDRTGRAGVARLRGAALALGLVCSAAYAAAPVAPTRPEPGMLAFPGALGWAARTPGGRGGRILKVTTLANDGPGSLRAALLAKGPRIVVFEVGGVIDLERSEIRIEEPYLTVAGQTAPTPGITLIRGGLDVATHDVVFRHMRIRSGTAGAPKGGGYQPDAFSTLSGARDVIVDHCSMSWAIDENLSASGTRFVGRTPEEWRANVSHRITFSHNLLAEGLAHANHAKGEHSKGSLVHDNVTDILIVGNLYAHNYERSPLFKGGVRGVVANNLIYNPGPRAVHYNLIEEEWAGHAYEVGRMTLVGNVLRAGPSTPDPLALFMLGGSGNVELHAADNIAVDRIGRALPQTGRYTTSTARIIPLAKRPPLPPGLTLIPAVEVQDAVIRDVGARPWDRDAIDSRIVADTIEGRGKIIDHEDEVGGYPVHTETRKAFDPDDWDLATMEPKVPPPPRTPPK